MAAAYFAALLLNPISLGLLGLIVWVITSVHYQRQGQMQVIRARRMLTAYAGALLAIVLVSAVISYVSPEEAWVKWQVPSENYWGAQLNEFFTTFAFALYASLIGIAIVGLPLILFLGRRGYATVPTVVLAASFISLLIAGLMSVGNDPPFRHFLSVAKELVSGHLVVAMGFCLGAGLPWRSRSDRI